MDTLHLIHSKAFIVYALPVGMMLSDMHVECHVLFKDLVAGRATVFLGRHVLIPHVCSHVFPLLDAPPTDEAGKPHGTWL